MLLKWIVCTVPATGREAFSQAQAQWATLSGLDGFIGQVGGWDRQNQSLACILGCWRDQAAYQHFMDHVHDEIVEKSNQRGTYEAISIDFFTSGSERQGVAADWPQALAGGTRLLVHDGLPDEDGLLRGVIGASLRDPHRSLVVTLWADPAARHTDTSACLQEIELESTWRVLASR